MLKLRIVDRIFTRVGASDNLSKGESTFMVEMAEPLLPCLISEEEPLLAQEPDPACQLLERAKKQGWKVLL